MANNTARLRRGSYRGGQPSFVTSLNTFRRPRRFLKQSTDRRTGPSLSNELCKWSKSVDRCKHDLSSVYSTPFVGQSEGWRRDYDCCFPPHPVAAMREA